MGERKSIEKMITVTIDGIQCQAKFGETILEIARANGIYVPTMCYLTKVAPIASCRMCVVEVEGVDGMILSCQEKAVDGAVITTRSDGLAHERQNIMKLYGVNHPLECGVCDKSGECELQNKTLEFGVDAQLFSTKEPNRPVENWGFVSYDPSLCIMCEKCVSVANEVTGSEQLQIHMGGYGSRIVNCNPEKLDMALGESAAVCPVGALVDRDFKYRANAWEMTRVPSTCSHCSAGCSLYYETKHDRIYRVSNAAEFDTLCGAGRYAFNFANSNACKNERTFTKAVHALENAKTILFDSAITNEEALILQKLKERKGYRLVSPQARAYQKFFAAYGSVTGKALYGGTLDRLSQSDAIVVLGTRISDDNPQVRYHMTTASRHNRAKVVYMHPMEDSALSSTVTQFIKYEVGSEEGVAALLAKTLTEGVGLPKDISAFFDDLDVGNLSAESNVGEEELETVQKSFARKERTSLVIGADLYAHPRAENIAKILALFEEHLGWNVIMVPPTTNALGVALICDLDDTAEGSTVGYNAPGDFVVSSFGDGDLDIPALNQQEGTFTSLERRVAPLNAAVGYGGYTLNDLANALGLKAKQTIDYTRQLPTEKGYRSVAFDDLSDGYNALGQVERGYLLKEAAIEKKAQIDAVEDLGEYDGIVAYQCNAASQYAGFLSPEGGTESAALVGSKQFAAAAKLSGGERIRYTMDGVVFERLFMIDTTLKGTIALNPVFDMGLSGASLSSYRFSRLKFERVED